MLFPLDKPFDLSDTTYTLNSQGYRCPEWDQIDWGNSYLLFGCSVVQGVGLEDYQTLDQLLEPLLGNPVINLGVGGGSLPFILANTYKLIDAGIKPKAVILVNPEPSRVALFVQPITDHVGVWSTEKWYRNWVKDKNAEYYGYLCRRSISTAWENLSIPFVEFHQPDVPGPQDLSRYVDKAKDNRHPGPETIKLWADYIAKKKPTTK